MQDAYRRFSDDREWGQFHDPKSLILALMGEVGELAELFQWIPADEAAEHFSAGDPRQRASEELADVLIYTMGIANQLGIDLGEAFTMKMASNERRFPVAAFNGFAPEKL